jgi:cytochrome b561
LATATVGGTVERYPAALVVLHWTMAVLILVAIPIGWRMGDLEPGPLQDALYHTHRSIGVTVLALAILRVVLRRTLGVPPPHPALAPWQRTLSVAVHHLLYVLFFVVPILGWAGTSAFGAPIVVWGLFELPPILPKSEPLSEVLLGVHGLFAQTLAGLVVLHVAGALYHAFVRRDGVMQRMLLRRGS